MFDNIGSLQVQIYVSEMALTQYGAHMTAKDGLKSDKNVVFSLLRILFGKPMEGRTIAHFRLPPFGYATVFVG